MSCTNCFNGCTEIVSDKCVKYTGVDVPALGITNGDTLLTVENAIVEFLVPMLNGGGIKPAISQSVICDTVKQYLPSCTVCTGFTLNEILVAVIRAVCDLQEQINDVVASVEAIEAPYTTDCLSGVTSSSNTHTVLQAVINKLCDLDADLVALALDLSTNYVQISELDALIQDYLDNTGFNSLIKNRMVPYAVQPYYGPLSYFDGTGAGTGNWIDVYLCNGSNGTPDLRGRTLVGVTSGMFGGALSAAVDPAIPGNPSYTLSGSIPPFSGSTTGANQITLTPNQIPSHTHNITTSVTVTEDPHRHKFSDDSTSPTNALRADNDILPFSTTPSSAIISGSGTGSGQIYETSEEVSGVNVSVSASAAVTGGGESHSNTQPSIACYYIMYIP